MYKKTINFTDYDGNERKEDFYFNMTEAEVMKYEFRTPGGLSKLMERIVQAQDTAQIIDVFEELVAQAYGVKSPDGREFIKNKDVLTSFQQTEAYSKLFMELATNAKAASEFFNSIVPQSLRDRVAEEEAKNNTPVLTPVQ